MKKVISPISGQSKYLLIENSEIVSEVAVSKDLKESLKLSAGKAGTLIVKNLPGTILNRENQNGRIYSTEVLAQAIKEARPLFETKQLLSQACEHPEGSFVSPTTASHVVTNAYIKKNVNLVVDGEQGRFDMLFMDIEVLNTEEGKNLRALLEAECSVGTSIRGVGDMEGKYVKNYEILGIDFVGNPSSSTFTRMPISESAKLEMKDERALKETFNVTTSSTNVVRDLDQAANIQQQLEGIGYGTVTKTSTKVDQETDPKTGAQTSITTLEAETSDEVSDLDQALYMAKNAMLNGVVHVDSITIENIDEEKNEAVEADYVPEKTTLKEKPTVTEAKKEEDDPNLGKKFVLHTDRGFVTYDKNAIDFTENPEDALHFTEGKEENGMVSMSKVTEILDAMGIFEVEKYFQRNKINLSAKEPTEDEQKEGLVGDVNVTVGDVGFMGGAGSVGKNENTTDTSLNEENGTNTRFLAKVTLETKSGTKTEEIPVSAVDKEAVKNEVGNLYNMKIQANDVNTATIQVVDTVTGKPYSFDPQNQKFTPIETQMEEAIDDEDVVEVDGDKVTTILGDDITLEKDFDSPLQAQVAASAAEQGQIDPKVLVPEAADDEDDDDDGTVICYQCEKQIEADQAYKLGDGIFCPSCFLQITGDVMKEEYDDSGFEDPVICSWCKDLFEKLDCKKEKDMGWLCDQCQRALESRGVELEFEEDVMDEKLFQQTTQPSDEFETATLQEEEDSTADFIVTLRDIHYDFDQILANTDLKSPEEAEELIDALPDPWTVRVNNVDIKKLENSSNNQEMAYVILQAANQHLPYTILSATVSKIEHPDFGFLMYDENWKKHTPTVEEKALEKVYKETDKFVITQDILDVLKSVTDKAVLKLVDQYENGLINGFTLLYKALEELENQ